MSGETNPAVVLVIGIGIGAAIQSSEVDQLEDEKAALQKKVNDREAQRRSDEAEARRVEQERQRTTQEEQRRQAADEQRRQQEEQRRLAEEQARQQQEQQRQQEAQQREAAQQNTLPGDGLFAVGADIRPGRFRTGGPSGGNPVGCYYAILNSPDTSEIATNNITKGPAIVDLSAGKYFETQSCQQWQRIG
jgi:flagellar biosynthesis GTPase FlhF